MISRRLLRIKVLQTYYAHRFAHDKSDISAAYKELSLSTQRFHHQYILLIDLLAQIYRLAEQRLEITSKIFQIKRSTTSISYYHKQHCFKKSFSLLGAALFVFEPRLIQNSVPGTPESMYIFLMATYYVFFYHITSRKFIWPLELWRYLL